jgi:hydrogenase/urease accessory protein HupE
MIPLSLPDKKIAIAGAFVNRFSIGFTLGAINLPLPGWASGLLFGLLLSLADAIITKSWVPILGLGAIGGVICGIVVGAFGV